MNRTNKYKEVIEYIKEFIKEHGYSPTVREIGKGTGLKSSATVNYHLHNLKQQGIITFEEKKQRTIRMIGEKNGRFKEKY